MKVTLVGSGGLECDTCGSFPFRAGLLTDHHTPGDRCPASYLDDYDCDGILQSIPARSTEPPSSSPDTETPE